MTRTHAVRWLVVPGALLVLCGASLAAEPTKSADVVKCDVTAAKPGADGTQVITVGLDVQSGWHVYANPVGAQLLETTATKVSFEGKAKVEVVKAEYPQGKTVHDDDLKADYRIYEGKVQIKATVKRSAGDGPLKVSVKVQACSEGQNGKCLIPSTITSMVD